MRPAASWLVRWAGAGLLGGALWLGARSLWLAARDPTDFAARRRGTLEQLVGEQARLGAALDASRQHTTKLAADAALEAGRARDAARAIQALSAGDRWWRDAWNKLFGENPEVRAKEDRLARLEATRKAAASRAAELHAEWTRATWEQDGAEIELARVNRQLAALERDDSAARHYLALAWARSRWYIGFAGAAWIVAGTALWRHRQRRGPEPDSPRRVP